MKVLELKDGFVFEGLKKILGNEDNSSIKILRSSFKKDFFVTMNEWDTIFTISSKSDGAEIKCLTSPTYGIFQTDFLKSEEEYLDENINFFYMLNSIKEVCYEANSFDKNDLYYDLLWCGEYVIPVPVFLNIVGKSADNFDALVKVFEEKGVFVAGATETEEKHWEYSIFPELTRKEILSFILQEGEQLEESILENGQKVICLSTKLPWDIVDFFEPYVVSKWHIGDFNIIPFGKQENWNPCQEDRGGELEENSNPIPFLTEDNGNKYYLVRNSGRYTQTRIEKKDELVAQEETQRYTGKDSFVFVVGKHIPDFKKWNANETVKITLSGYKIPGTDSEHRRYPSDNVEGIKWGIQYEEFPLHFLSTRKNHKEDEALVWKDSEFVRMCVLFPELAKNREKALALYKKFKWLNEEERAKVFKNRFTILGVIEKALSESNEFEKIKINSFVRIVWYGTKDTRVITIKLGGFFEISGWADYRKEGERFPLIYSTSVFLAKTSLVLALFNEKIE